MNKKLAVQKSHPYRVGGLFRHLGPIQFFQKLQFVLFGLPVKQHESVLPFMGFSANCKGTALTGLY